jgi:aryl-phospho-beta-D-glucosidase BglC (GH1 family)
MRHVAFLLLLAAARAASPSPACIVEYSTETVATQAAEGERALSARAVPAAFVGRGALTLVSHAAADLPPNARLAVEFAAPAVVGGATGMERVAPSAGANEQSFMVDARDAAGRPTVAYEVAGPSSDYAPAAVSLAGAPCTVRPAAASVAPSPPTEIRKLGPPGYFNKFLEEKPVSTRGAQLIGVDGAPLTIKGVNWFGYENGQTNPDGLWGKVDDAIVADFVNVVWRMQLLGFNTIRLPFSFRDLESATPKDPKYATCKAITPAEMAASVTPPGVTPPVGPVPPIRAPVAKHDPTICNDYVPMDSMRNRFFWAMRYIAANGFYVIIDDHLAYDTLVLDDATKWVASWKALAADIAKDPLLKNRVMLDLLNEPDARGIKWQTGPKGPGFGMAKYYEDAMDAIYAVHPTALMLIEGCGQLGLVAMNWGDGFATDAAVVKAGGVEDARPFFEAIVKKPYANNVVISPHIYPPSISTHNEPEVVLAPGLFTRLDNSFGYLTKTGFCPTAGGPCKLYPVVYGETGAKFDKELDVKFLEDFARYMTTSTDGHAPTPNMVWWCWNANSGDTGGVVNDQWKEINWFKIGWLMRAAGLAPWALDGKPLPDAANKPPVGTVGAGTYGANAMFDQGAGKPPAAVAAPVPAKPAAPAAPAATPAATPEPTAVPAATPPAAPCPDTAPDSQYTCAQQASWGKCGEDWLVRGGYCQKACGRCPKPQAVLEASADGVAVAGAGAPTAMAAAAPGAAPRRARARATVAGDTQAVAAALAAAGPGQEATALEAVEAVLEGASPAHVQAVVAQLEAADAVATLLQAVDTDPAITDAAVEVLASYEAATVEAAMADGQD